MSFSDQFGDDDALTVSDYTRKLKLLLEGNVKPSWVSGEVLNFRRQVSGHLYFTLKDQGAQLPCVMFRGNASSISFDLRDGLEALAYGEISVYEPHGKYQLIVRAIVESGAGRLHREFERLKRKLHSEGLFDQKRKKPLPVFPTKVAFITSQTGAAIQDFIRVLKRRGWRGQMVLFPAKVQGQRASDEIIKALRYADRLKLFDVIVVGRGGGSLEDLWCFNEEALARAISNMDTPVISAVGHEIDFTLSDFVADARAETPSSAAELITSAFLESEQKLMESHDRIEGTVDWAMQELERDLFGLKSRLVALSPRNAVENSTLKLDDLMNRLNAGVASCLHSKSNGLASSKEHFARLQPRYRVAVARDRVKSFDSRLQILGTQFLSRAAQRLSNSREKMRGMDPKATLKRGYVFLSDNKKRPIRKVDEVPENAPIEATFCDGSVRLRKD